MVTNTGSAVLFLHLQVALELLPQGLRQKGGAALALVVGLNPAGTHRLRCDEPQFAHSDAGAADGLVSPFLLA